MIAAATKLGLTQPALSKHLKALEGQVPLPLFGKTGQRKTLTPFGQDLFQALRPRMVNLQELIHTTALAQEQHFPHHLRLRARREVLDRISGQLNFAGTLYLQEGGHDDIVHALKQGQIDLGITHTPPLDDNLIAKSLFKETFQFVVPKKLLSKPPTHSNFFQQLRLIPAVAYQDPDVVMAAACRSQNINAESLRYLRITPNYPSLYQFVRQGIGWGVLPQLPQFTSETLWTHPVANQVIPGREFYLLYRKEIRNRPWLRDLIKGLVTN